MFRDPFTFSDFKAGTLLSVFTVIMNTLFGITVEQGIIFVIGIISLIIGMLIKHIGEEVLSDKEAFITKWCNVVADKIKRIGK